MCVEEAARLYEKVLHPILGRNRGAKRPDSMLEDSGPTGYKRTKGKNAKAARKINAIDFPRFARPGP